MVVLAFGLTRRLLPPRRVAGENARVVRLDASINKPKYRDAVPVSGRNGLPWTGDIEAALSQARRDNKLVLLAFVGKCDTNAALNNRVIFPQQAVQDALEPYVRVMLYIDYVPETFFAERTTEAQREAEVEANRKLHEKAFRTAASPLYAVVEPVGRSGFAVVGDLGTGRITDVGRFVQFLRDPAPERASTPLTRLRKWLGW
jgi:hypothetical protein